MIISRKLSWTSPTWHRNIFSVVSSHKWTVWTMAFMLWPERQNDKSFTTAKCKKMWLFLLTKICLFLARMLSFLPILIPRGCTPFSQHQELGSKGPTPMLRVKSNKIWLPENMKRLLCYVQKIGPSHGSQFLVLNQKKHGLWRQEWFLPSNVWHFAL